MPDAELVGRLAGAQEVEDVDAEMAEEDMEGGGRRLAHADRRDLAQFDHRDARVELLALDRVLDDEGGDPAGGAATDDNDVGHGSAPGTSTGTTSTFWLGFCEPEVLRMPGNRRDVLIVAADGDDDVALAGEGPVGRVVADPAGLAAAPGAHPGMHGVGALQALGAGRRNGAQEAADIGGGNADAAQAGDHQVREILADAALQLEDPARRGLDLGRLLVVAEVAVDALAEVPDDLLHGRGAREALAGVGGDLAVQRHARTAGDEMVRRIGRQRAHARRARAASLARSGETSSIAGRGLDAHAGAHADLQRGVGLAIGDRDDGVAEEIVAVRALEGHRVEDDRRGDDALAAGQSRRRHAHEVAAADDGRVVFVFELQADVVVHAAQRK